jgi:XTP/dITP diphosphohydrolase
LVERKILLATGNRGKVKEMRELLAPTGIEVLGLGDIPAGGMAAPEETGATFCENALLKARVWMERTGLCVLADDSGLAVDYLDGAPGIFSARFAGENATDRDNNALLLQKLNGVPAEKRTAAFHCCIAFCCPGQPELTFDGKAEGVILTAPVGNSGFGYDPLFFYPPLNQTFAQLPAGQKNSVSHRAAALALFIAWLRDNPLPA